MYVRALGSAALAFDSLSRNSYNLSMKSIVSEKGQVTIPKALRVSLAISPGTELDFTEENGMLIARRVVPSDRCSSLVGILPSTDVDGLLADLRGPAWTSELDERHSFDHGG